MKGAFPWLTLAMAFAPADVGSARIDSKYTRLDSCKLIESGPLGEDWILTRCRGYGAIAVWSTVTDSARAHLGFGARPNVSGIFEPAVPDRKRMVEWRGTIMRGRFTPFAVIVRLRWPEETKSFLTIYRLRDDGTSCIVGETEGSNEAARAIADRSLTTFKCSEEPQVR